MQEWFEKNNDSTSIMNANLDELTQKFGATDKSAVEFVKAVQDGNFTLDQGKSALQNYNQYMVETGRATEAAAIKTKLFTVAAKAASMIGSEKIDLIYLVLLMIYSL